MANVEVIRTGFLMGERVPRPKRGPDDFAWPSPRLADATTRLNFRTRIIEELRARGMTHKDLALVAHGEVRHKKSGRVVPRMPTPARQWVMGKAFPNAATAEGLAGYFKISTAELLQPKGELEPMEFLRARNGEKPKAARKKANGHDHGAAAHRGNGVHRVDDDPPPPPLQLPDGANPAVVELKSFPGDSRFMAVSISGVLPVDQALALVAMIHPRHG